MVLHDHLIIFNIQAALLLLTLQFSHWGAGTVAASSVSEFKNISEVIWTTEAACVRTECRLEESATLHLLTTSCARERCSLAEVTPSSFGQLEQRSLAIAVPVYDSRVVQAAIRYLGGVVDVFILERKDGIVRSSPSLADLYEYGKRTHKTVDIIKAIKQGSFGGIRAMRQGPVPRASDLLKKRLVLHDGKIKEAKYTLKECTRLIRRNSIGLRDEDMEEYIKQMSISCLMHSEEEDDAEHLEDGITSVAAVDQGRDELWEKALQLGLVPDGPLRSLSALAYRDKIWSEIENDVRLEHQFWLSVSWVPVFDELHDGLGHGDRYEVLLLELVHVEPFTEVPDVSPVIVTRSGKQARVRHRRLLALSACDDDELESVLKCIRASISNVFLFNQIVWGMGFVGDDKYRELEPDWNADPMYASHGEMPPKYEDEEMLKQNAKDDQDVFPRVRDEI